MVAVVAPLSPTPKIIENNRCFNVFCNETHFEVKVAGIKLFSVKSISKEKYQNDQLIEFKSETMQNDKKKFVNLVYNRSKDVFIIDLINY